MTTSPHTTSRRTARIRDAELIALIRAARDGDELAWSRIVRRLDPKLRGALRSYRLSGADVDDALQATWMLLYCNVDRIRDPAAVTSWLVTTVRRQALELIRSHDREWLTEEPERGPSEDGSPESELLDAERREVLRRALGTLPPRQRRVVTLLAAQPALDYAQFSALLAMPVGSIGPTRARGLARLGRDAELRSLVLAA